MGFSLELMGRAVTIVTWSTTAAGIWALAV